jgi:hypothetical protein
MEAVILKIVLNNTPFSPFPLLTQPDTGSELNHFSR